MAILLGKKYLQGNAGNIGQKRAGSAMLTARPYERRKSAMIARIGLLERVNMMREFRDKVLDLHEEFWEILTEKLAP